MTVFAKSSMLDVWRYSEHISVAAWNNISFKALCNLYMLKKIQLRISKLAIYNFIRRSSYTLCEKCQNTEFFSGPYFPVFGLNTEIYEVNLCIQSEYGKIRTRKNSIFWHFSRSDIDILITVLHFTTKARPN